MAKEDQNTTQKKNGGGYGSRSKKTRSSQCPWNGGGNPPAGCPIHTGSNYYVRHDPEPCKPADPSEPSGEVIPPGPISPYCRLFDRNEEHPGDDDLVTLGETMQDDGSLSHLNSNIPAGYTYLGQFIDHDITSMDGAADLTDTSPERVEQLKNMRTRTLDLDSVYGDDNVADSLRDGEKMKIGITTPSGGTTNFELPNDLPRSADKKALIGDKRNDENLAIAQTHLAFLKLHNRFVDKLGMDFSEAKKATIQHYQSMVIKDYLRRVISPGIYSEVFECNREPSEANKIECMPVEFAVAAFRFGHSMVRNRYEWNRVFRTGGEIRAATLSDLFQFTAFSGDLRGLPTLPTNWVVDWRRLYDFGLGTNGPAVNMARKIDTKLALRLEDLPEFSAAGDTHLKNLSIRNLLRGKQMQLPSGQQIAAQIGAESIDGKIATGNSGLDKNTPLWYYILRESIVQQEGNKLGEVGSWIVAMTFKQLILDSDHSVLGMPGFIPNSEMLGSEGHVTMPGILRFIGDINPLGN